MHINMVAPYQGILDWVGTPNEWSSQATGETGKTVSFNVKYLDHQMQERLITFELSSSRLVDQLLTLPIGTEIRVAWRPTTKRYEKDGVLRYFPAFSAFAFRVIPPGEQTKPLPDQRPAQRAPQQQAYQQQAYQQPAGYGQQPVYQQQPPFDQGPTDDLPL